MDKIDRSVHPTVYEMFWCHLGWWDFHMDASWFRRGTVVA